MTIFSDQQLAGIINNTLPDQMPAGHRNAIVGSVDASGAQVVVAVRKDTVTGTWQLQAAARHEWSGDNQVGAKVIVSW